MAMEIHTVFDEFINMTRGKKLAGFVSTYFFPNPHNERDRKNNLLLQVSIM
jgi:hypothetical protein